jgi:membrane protein
MFATIMDRETVARTLDKLTLPTPGGGRVPLRKLAKILYRKYGDHAVTSSSATLSYYFLFSLFPFLFFLVTLTTYLPVFSPSMQEILNSARTVLPPEAMALVDHHLQGVKGGHARLLTLGLFVTLYTASRGVDAVRAALNLAYDVKESRPFWKTEGIAFGVTIGGAVLILVSVSAVVAGGDLGFWVARHLHVGPAYVLAWQWARWPVTLVLLMYLAALGYYLLPDVEQEFKFITPGSVLGTLVAILASWGFSRYASHFGSYDVAYGSIGGVVVLMTWFYILGLIYLVGGEINATLEHQSPEGKDEGARAPGEKAPPKRERPSAVPVGAAHSQDAAERSPGGAAPSAPVPPSTPADATAGGSR